MGQTLLTLSADTAVVLQTGIVGGQLISVKVATKDSVREIT
jgi:hypothetical protein